MAIRVLIGSDIGSTASYQGGVLPVTGDEVHIYEGSQTLTNLGALTATVDLNRIYVGPAARVICEGWAIDVNNGTNPRIECYGSGGRFWVNGAVTKAVCRGGMELRATGGTWARVLAREGLFRAAGGTITRLDAIQSAVTLEAGTAIDILNSIAAQVVSSRTIKVGGVYGRSRLILADGATVADGGNGVLTVADPQAVVELLSQTAGITLDEVVGLAGSIITQNARGPIAITDSTFADRFNMQASFPAGTNGQVTFTNPSTLLGSPSVMEP